MISASSPVSPAGAASPCAAPCTIALSPMRTRSWALMTALTNCSWLGAFGRRANPSTIMDGRLLLIPTLPTDIYPEIHVLHSRLGQPLTELLREVRPGWDEVVPPPKGRCAEDDPSGPRITRSASGKPPMRGRPPAAGWSTEGRR